MSYLLPRDPIVSTDVQLWQQTLIQVALTFGLYGVQVALLIAAVPVLVRKEGRAWILMGTVFVLFVASTMAAASVVQYMIEWVHVSVQLELRALGGHPSYDFEAHFRTLRRIHFAFVMACRINYVLSDGLVIWRAWVLWPDSRIARGILLVFLLGSLGASLFDGLWLGLEYSELISLGAPSLPAPIVMAVSLFLTNFVATILVGIRVWIYRRDVTLLIGPFSTGSGVAGVLMLLLESGGVYTALWVFEAIIVLAAEFRKPMSLFLWEARYISLFFPTPLDNIFALLAGIYPTFLVVVVTLYQHSTAQSMLGGQSSFLGSLRFVSRGGMTSGRQGTATAQSDMPEEIALASLRGGDTSQ